MRGQIIVESTSKTKEGEGCIVRLITVYEKSWSSINVNVRFGALFTRRGEQEEV